MDRIVIFTYLPLKTEFEMRFWNEMSDAFKNKGYQVVHFGNKRLNNINVININMPRNLDTLYEEYKSEIFIYIERKKSILGRNVLADCLEREIDFGQVDASRSRNVGYYVLRYIEQKILEYCNKYYVGAIITWGQLTPVSLLARKIGNVKTIPTFEAERAPLNNFIWIEREGIFGEAKVWKCKIEQNVDLIRLGKDIRKELIRNVYGFRENGNSRGFTNFIPKDKKVFFLPMDNIYEVGWLPERYSISQKRFPFFCEPMDYINKLNLWVKEHNGILIVKPHPSCNYFDVSKEYDFIMTKGDLKELLILADVVICNYTKVAFAALALKKKVVVLAKNIILLSGICNYYPRIEEIKWEEVNCELDRNSSDIIDNFFGWLAKKYFWSCDNICDFVEKICERSFGKSMKE
jgi:Putative glycosyl/glycerophosphate transferases involved in teichoic acid biosynthesis TagF/TagB/EpsJ/RodC